MLFFLLHGAVLAQEGRFKKSLNVRPNHNQKDTTADDDHPPPGDKNQPGFDPHKELSIVSEDTTDLDEGELTVVEVSEELKVDSIWIKIADYYAIWDSRNINPYHIDPAKFEDTVSIELYNPTKNQLWAPPLLSTSVTSQFGMRGYRWHYGTDLELDTGDSVRAAFDGIVRIVRFDPHGYGYYVVLRHYNGLETLYGHLSKQLVEVGQMLKAGELLGWGGSTGRSSGPHLHYEVRYQGNAVNPAQVYDWDKNALFERMFTLTPEHFAYFSSRKKAQVRRSVYHVVRSGDNLGSIARRYGTSVTNLCRMNRISSRTKIRAGQRLKVR